MNDLDALVIRLSIRIMQLEQAVAQLQSENQQLMKASVEKPKHGGEEADLAKKP